MIKWTDKEKALEIIKNAHKRVRTKRKNRCETCEHWSEAYWDIYASAAKRNFDKPLKEVLEIEGTLRGSCHRFPPEADKSFPYLYAGSYCGEWKRRDKDSKERIR